MKDAKRRPPSWLFAGSVLVVVVVAGAAMQSATAGEAGATRAAWSPSDEQIEQAAVALVHAQSETVGGTSVQRHSLAIRRAQEGDVLVIVVKGVVFLRNVPRDFAVYLEARTGDEDFSVASAVVH